MSSNEMTIEQARAKLGDLVIKAMRGQTTTLTRYGKPVARIVPIQEPAVQSTQEPIMITLYETNSDLLILARDGKAWDMGSPGASPGYLEATFAADAQAWAEGDWIPSEGDGQHPTEVGDDVTAVAQWTAGQGVRLLVHHEQLGGAAATYIGERA